MKELKRLIPYLVKYKWHLTLGFIFVTISNICSTYAPRIVGRTVDTIKSGDFSESTIMELIGTFILLVIGSGTFMFLTRRTIIVASRLVEYDLRNDFLDAVQKQSMAFFSEKKTGDLMAHATNDINAAREFLGPAIMYGANTITTFSFALYFMLILDPSITLLALLPLPFMAYAVYRLGKKIHVAFREVQEKFSDLTSQAQETFSGTRVIRAYNREENENRKFFGLSRDYFRKNYELAKIQSGMMPSLMILVGMSQLIVLGYGGYKVILGTATLGDLTQFFIYLNLLIWPVVAIGWVTNLVQRASASVGRIGKIIDSEPTVHSREDGEQRKIEGDIRFSNVSLKYPLTKSNVLENINIEISKGSSLGIVGPVGSGKTTFINLIARLYDPTNGEIFIDGKPIKDISLRDLRNSIGFVSQEPFLFSLTIEENIKFGKPDASKEQVEKIAKIVQLHDEVMTFPDKYDTLLGERGISLSGGQKQRLAIARAILREPKILILDDALSAVDAQTEEKILKELKKIMKGRTTIIISHRVSAVKDTNKIITIDKGEIVESGTHADLIENKGKYSEMYELQKLEEEIEMMD